MSTGFALPEVEVEEQQEQRTQLFPVHVIVVYNDDDHTFEYVIELFAKVLKYSIEHCKRLAIGIHKEGRQVVWSGTKEHGEFKLEQLRAGGPDLWAIKRVDYPIQCELQPLD